MDDREQIITRLQSIESRVQEINRVLEGRSIDEARERFRELKQHLEDEYRKIDTIKGEAKLSRLEKAFYAPAIRDALTNTGISNISPTSRPEKWKDALWGVEDYMRH